MMQEVSDVIQKHIAIMKNEEVVPVIAASASLAAVGGTPSTIQNGKKRKIKKEDVDPNKPKKSASAYLLYMAEHQAPYKLANPTVHQTEIMSVLGKAWTGLATEGKEKYIVLANQKKEEYEEVLAAYNQSIAILPMAAIASLSSSSSSSSASPPTPKPVVLASKPELKVVAPVANVPVPAVTIPMVATIEATGNDDKEHKKKKKRTQEEKDAEKKKEGSGGGDTESEKKKAKKAKKDKESPKVEGQ